MTRSTKSDNLPTVSDYFKAAHALATLVRATLDNPGSVKKGRIRRALEHFEQLDYEAMG